MAKHIAIYSDTLGDIEINGFLLMTDKEIKDFEDLASSITWPFLYPLGESEEELEFSSGEDLLTKIDFREITNEEYKILKKLFDTAFGTFITEDYLYVVVGEEGDTDEEEEKDEETDEYF